MCANTELRRGNRRAVWRLFALATCFVAASAAFADRQAFTVPYAPSDAQVAPDGDGFERAVIVALPTTQYGLQGTLEWAVDSPVSFVNSMAEGQCL